MARPTQRPGNLPAEATSFIGRRRELAEIRRKLAEARLVSLVGPGGVGKTRLALRAATEVGRRFRDGGWWVELAELRDPALVVNAVIAAVDLRDQATADPLELLLDHLKGREVLLVLDNCEHLLDAVTAMVANVIRAAPGVRMVATSREPLSVAGEHVVPVPPLDLPPTNTEQPAAELRQNEAVALFIERAAAASGGFELTSSNREAVVDVCRRLDGLPLAIELAAVRTRVLTAEQVRDRLTDRFGLLTHGSRAALPRHQTLRTTIEWSLDLLTEGERALLRRLGVFAGRFTLEDVESVGASEDAGAVPTLDLLSSLVDKSLVVKEESANRATFRLHETMREFAALKLREAGEANDVERRCADYLRSRCSRSGFEGRLRMLDWLQWMDVESDNVRWVLQRSLLERDVETGLDVASSLAWYWMTRATSEGVRWLDQFLAAAGADADSHPRAQFVRGFLAVLQSDPASARPALARAAATAKEEGQLRLLAESLAMGSIAANMSGDRESARGLLQQSEVVAAGLDDHLATLAMLQARALNGLFEGDLETVRAASTEGARLGREAGDLYSLEVMLINAASIALTSGDFSGSRPLLEEALRIAARLDDRVAQFYLLDAFAYHFASTGRARTGAQLLGAADSVRAGTGARVMGFAVRFLAGAKESATAALGTDKFQAQFEAGRHLSRESAVRLALGEPTTAAPAPAGESDGLLGKRQADVARLIAMGLSNKQIGARLFISERTVDSHVRSILNKLGLNSRAQIAAWVAASPGSAAPTD